MGRCRLCGFSKPFSLGVSKTRGRSWPDSQTSEAKGTYRERPRTSENQARSESGPGPGSESIFYKECCFRVRVRVRVSLRSGFGLGWG